MVNVNPANDSHSLDYHTHYMQMRPDKRYVVEYWRYNEAAERTWVPWDWCTTVKQQTRNNSMVIFAPSSDTLHAVKARYDHLQTQRTQLYGNFWYHHKASGKLPSWRGLVIDQEESRSWKLTDAMPAQLKRAARVVVGDSRLQRISDAVDSVLRRGA